MFVVDATEASVTAVHESAPSNAPPHAVCPSACIGCTLTATRHGLLLFGGRTSPAKATNCMYLWRLQHPSDAPDAGAMGHTAGVTCREANNDGDGTNHAEPRVLAWQHVGHGTTAHMCVPTGRWRHTTVALDADVVVVFGGRTAAGVVSDGTTTAVGRVEAAPADTDANGTPLRVVWGAAGCVAPTGVDVGTPTAAIDTPPQFRQGPVPCGRYAHTAVAWRGCMVVYGGVSADHTRLADVAVLARGGHTAAASLAWTWKDMHRAWCPALPPRFAHASAVVDDTMVVVGGLGSTLVSPAEQVMAIVSARHREECTRLGVSVN